MSQIEIDSFNSRFHGFCIISIIQKSKHNNETGTKKPHRASSEAFGVEHRL